MVNNEKTYAEDFEKDLYANIEKAQKETGIKAKFSGSNKALLMSIYQSIYKISELSAEKKAVVKTNTFYNTYSDFIERLLEFDNSSIMKTRIENVFGRNLINSDNCLEDIQKIGKYCDGNQTKYNQRVLSLFSMLESAVKTEEDIRNILNVILTSSVFEKIEKEYNEVDKRMSDGLLEFSNKLMENESLKDLNYKELQENVWSIFRNSLPEKCNPKGIESCKLWSEFEVKNESGEIKDIVSSKIDQYKIIFKYYLISTLIIDSISKEFFDSVDYIEAANLLTERKDSNIEQFELRLKKADLI